MDNLTKKQKEYYIAAARERYAERSDDNIEVDSTPVTKFSVTDDGVWVQGWLWVPHRLCDRCSEPYDEAKGDGYCGLCPKCADETEPTYG